MEHPFEQFLWRGGGVEDLAGDLDGRHARLPEHLGQDLFTSPLEDAAEVCRQVFLPPNLLALHQERPEYFRCWPIRKRLDGLGEKFREAVALRLVRIVAGAPAKLHLMAPERLEPGQRMPDEAEEKFFLLRFVQQNIRRPVVKRPDVIRGDSHRADRLPYGVARGAADVEEDRMRENQCHDRMTRKRGQREPGGQLS